MQIGAATGAGARLPVLGAMNSCISPRHHAIREDGAPTESFDPADGPLVLASTLEQPGQPMLERALSAQRLSTANSTKSTNSLPRYSPARCQPGLSSNSDRWHRTPSRRRRDSPHRCSGRGQRHRPARHRSCVARRPCGLGGEALAGAIVARNPLPAASDILSTANWPRRRAGYIARGVASSMLRRSTSPA